MFDLTTLRMQVALAEGNMSAVESHRQRMVEIAMLLEEKTTIPVVKAQLEFLASMQESGFWEKRSTSPPLNRAPHPLTQRPAAQVGSHGEARGLGSLPQLCLLGLRHPHADRACPPFRLA